MNPIVLFRLIKRLIRSKFLQLDQLYFRPIKSRSNTARRCDPGPVQQMPDQLIRRQKTFIVHVNRTNLGDYKLKL